MAADTPARVILTASHSVYTASVRLELSPVFMADSVSKATRSKIMASVKGKDTHPEMMIRRGLHAEGFRYRLHARNLPGKPDLVFRKYRAVIFVNGCFWHGHECPLLKWPASNEEFWRSKISGNMERDRKNLELLRTKGWRTLTVWGCALRGRYRHPSDTVIRKVIAWLISTDYRGDIRGDHSGIGTP